MRRGALPGSDGWVITEMLPGTRPLHELEAALLRVAVNPPNSLMEQLEGVRAPHEFEGTLRTSNWTNDTIPRDQGAG